MSWWAVAGILALVAFVPGAVAVESPVGGPDPACVSISGAPGAGVDPFYCAAMAQGIVTRITQGGPG